jgi:hypothetical protein
MSRDLEVVICGGGHVAHALAAVIGASPYASVRIVTRRPEIWHSSVQAVHNELVVIGHPAEVTANPAVVAGANLVFIAAPAYAHCAILSAIGPFISPHTWVGALPAPGFFDWAASAALGSHTRIFGAQRSPYNCRITEQGREVTILGIVPRLAVAATPRQKGTELIGLVAAALSLPVDLLDNFLCATLAPSPSIFHPARLFSLLSDWDGCTPFKDVPLFYEDWDDTASDIYLRCDGDLQAVCRALPLDMSGVIPLYAHYGVSTASALTSRIRGLAGLRTVALPTCVSDTGQIPDLQSRFFTEDFPFGLRAVRAVARLAKVETPTLDLLDAWFSRAPISVGPVTADCTQRIRGCSLQDIVGRATLT